MGGGGGGSKKKSSPAPPPQAQPIDYGALMAQASAAAQAQYRDQLAAQIESYPKMEELQLGTISKISSNLNNRYTQEADDALQAAASETIKLTQAGDRIGDTATRANQIATDAQQFAAGPTNLDRQIASLGASAMDQRPDQVAGAQIAPVEGMQAASIGPVERVSGSRVAAARMGNVQNVQGPAGYAADQVRAQRALAAQGAAAQMDSVDNVGTRNIRASAAERALMNEALGGGLLGQLESQASNDLALGRSLSAEQERDAIQAARAGAAARGMATGNSAMAAELLNRDRFATQRENERRTFAAQTLNQGTGIRQAANQASLARREGNAVRNLQADLANQSTAFNTGQFNASTQQAMELANMQNRQQAALANQQAALQASQLNQAANARAAEFQQQGGLQAALANQQTQFGIGQLNAQNRQAANLAAAGYQQQAALANQDLARQLGLTEASFQQAANAANFDAATTRAFTEAGYRQQAALANQDANQRQVEMNRAFLQNANQSGINSEISRGGYAMGALGQTANLYGQQAGAYQNAAALGLNIANQSMANDPYMRAFAPGTTIGGGTLSTSANMIGNTWQGATQMAGNVASFNANMIDSRYNSWANNQAALQGARMQAGAAAGASQNAMMGSGMAAGGMVLGMTALAI